MFMEQFVLDFFSKVGDIDFHFVMSILGYSLIAFWIVVLYWVWLDSGERTSKVAVRILFVLLALVLNVVGLIIYLLIRPSQTIEEIYWSDLEKRYLKYETSELGDCPKCGTQLYPGYNFCPNCKYKLKVKCSKCGLMVDRGCDYCPTCGEKVRNLSSTTPDVMPSKEVMEGQIQATRDEVIETVESNGVKYSTKKGIAVKIGDGVLSFVDWIKSLFNKNQEESEEETEEEENISDEKKDKKKK